jgi:hypothetical protein
MSRLFRETPPLDLIQTMMTALGFQGLNDTRLFCSEELKLDDLESWVPLLQPYYLPCKAKRYFETLDDKRIVTILRHVLPYHGFRLQAYERVHLGKKRTVYQIHPATPRLVAEGGEIRVLFL